MRRPAHRGPSHARSSLSEEEDSFGRLLLDCGNFGLVGTATRAAPVLRTLHRIATSNARIVLDSVDPHYGIDTPAELAYQARNRGLERLPGQVTIRLRYGAYATPWFELLNVSARELEDLLADTWRLAHLVEGEPSDYYAVLEKDRGGE